MSDPKNQVTSQTQTPQRAVLPAVDVYEDDAGITLLADMPGVPRDQLELKVEGDALSFQVTSAPPKQRLGATENRASTLASRAPGTTIAYAE